MSHNGPNPDRWPVEAWRNYAPTVWDMFAGEWRVFARCDRCDLRLRVSLKTIIRVKGRNFVLWGQTQPCKNGRPEPFGCGGTMYFESRPPGALQVFRLACTEPGGGKPRSRGNGCGWL